MLGLVALALVLGGILLWAIGAIMVISSAFGESMGWGVATFLIPFATFAYMAKHPEHFKGAFALHVYGLIMLIGGIVLVARM